MASSGDLPALMLQSESTLSQPANPDMIFYCPTMDLIAIADKSENLDVYRLNGQRAFGLRRKATDKKITSICWKFNGHSLAIAWSDGSVDIISAETGKIIRHGVHESVGVPGNSPSQISCLAWGVNFISTESVKRKIASKGPGLRSELLVSADDFGGNDYDLDDFLDRRPRLQSLEIDPDLPTQLSLIDVESQLPKLPPLPLPPTTGIMRATSSNMTEIFTSQASVDSMLHTNQDANAVDVLLRCYEGGSIDPMIYDSLEVGRLRLPENWHNLRLATVSHAYHPFSCSHSLIMKAQPNLLAFVPLSFRFLPSAGLYLHHAISKTAELQQLIKYVHQCLKCIGDYWRHTFNLPSRWIANANEALESQGEGDLVQNLYHLAVTGHCSPTVKEWLVDDVGENNHKRWDQASSQGYAKIVELAHENLVPSLDRCSVVVCTLRGLANYHSSVLDIPSQDFSRVLDIIKDLHLVANKLLLKASEERRQFSAFSVWLRLEMERQRTELSQNNGSEPDLGTAYVDVLAYIRGSMTKSALTPFLSAPTAKSPTEALGDRRSSRKSESSTSNFNAISMSSTLQDAASNLVDKISSWQRSGISMDFALVLENEEWHCARSRVIAQDEVATYVAIVQTQDQSRIRVHRIAYADACPQLSSISSYNIATIQFGGGSISDVQFVDDDSVIAIWVIDEVQYLISLPLAALESLPTSALPSGDSSEALPASYIGFSKASSLHCSTQSTWDLRDMDLCRPFVKHIFSREDMFSPVRLEVNGRKHRRVVLVLDQDVKRYRIYDLDFSAQPCPEPADVSMVD